MGYTNQPEEVIDELANILKSQNESSLTEETEQPVQEEQTEVQETGEVQQEEPTLENAEMPEQESSEITAEDYEAMRAELEKLKSAGNNVDVHHMNHLLLLNHLIIIYVNQMLRKIYYLLHYQLQISNQLMHHLMNFHLLNLQLVNLQLELYYQLHLL